MNLGVGRSPRFCMKLNDVYGPRTSFLAPPRFEYIFKNLSHTPKVIGG